MYLYYYCSIGDKPYLEKEELSNQPFRIFENSFKSKSFRLFYLFLALTILPKNLYKRPSLVFKQKYMKKKN